MLINSDCVVQAPSRRVALAPSQQLAGFGPDAVVRERGWAGLAVKAGRKSGIWSGGASAAAGYLPGLEGSFQASVVAKSTVQNSTDQHNTIQVTRLVPASRGEVGPHPVREPGPA